MQYTVPKFIDQEDKIIAFVTVRQFLIMIVGGILIAVSYAIFSFAYFLLAAIVIGLVTAVISFVKVNGRPFHFFLINFLERTKKPRVRVWNKELTESELRLYMSRKPEELPQRIVGKKRLQSTHLSQLSLIVDTGGSYQGEDLYQQIKPQK